MRHVIAIATLASAVVAAMASAAPAETVNGVTVLRGPSTVERTTTTVLRGRPITPPGSSEADIGSGSSTPPGNGNYRPDRSGAMNSLHTGSANAGGAFNNLPPSLGR